jgi:hypothetical protein
MTTGIDANPVRQQGRGIVIFHFGYAYALRLLVCLYTLRKHYAGPVTVFLRDDKAGQELRPVIESLGINVEMKQGFSQSFDRHRVFLESPYATTISIDSDTIFQGPIDELWEPLEREGALLTRFRTHPYGVEGSPERRGWGDRMILLDGVKSILKPEDYEATRERFIVQGIDVNIGLMGFSRPKGDAFLLEWAAHLEQGRSLHAPIMDEMLINALLGRHRCYLTGDMWNCPASEFYRFTSPYEARMVHYFSDGNEIFGARMARSTSTLAGRLWLKAYAEAGQHVDLARWRKYDPFFDGLLKVVWKFIANQPYALMYTLRRLSNAIKRLLGGAAVSQG